jgi:hypothetical protein
LTSLFSSTAACRAWQGFSHCARDGVANDDRAVALSLRLPAMAMLLIAVVLCLLTTHLAPAQPTGAPVSQVGTALSMGAASLKVRDPIDQLAIDIAEHLPMVSGVQVLPPLPLHVPLAAPGEPGADELQGAELIASLECSAACVAGPEHHAPPHGAPFASTAPRRHERPPRAALRRQP